MSKNMFDLDDELLNDNKYSEELDRADSLCMREQFDRAIEIYNKVLDSDMRNERALLGILKVHSAYYTIYDGPGIEKDIRIIERVLPNINNPEYLYYCKKKNSK